MARLFLFMKHAEMKISILNESAYLAQPPSHEIVAFILDRKHIEANFILIRT